MSGAARTTGHDVPFGEAARFWIKLGFINFGGPAGQIAVMHEEIVERRGWISEARFMHALSYCTLLPGPEAQQLAIYVGWLLHKVRGGILAGIAFILPAFFLIGGLSWVYAAHGQVPAIQGVFDGLQAAVVGIVAAAMIRIASCVGQRPEGRHRGGRVPGAADRPRRVPDRDPRGGSRGGYRRARNLVGIG